MARNVQPLRDASFWLSPRSLLIITAGLGGIGLIALRFVSKGPTLTVMALAGAIVALLVLLRPQIGLYAVIACAGVVRVKAGTGTGSPIVASLGCALILCACWLVSRHLNGQRVNLLPRQIWVPGLLMIFFICFSLLWGRATLDPRIEVPGKFITVQIAGGMIYVLSIGLLFVGGDLLRDRETRSWLVIALLAIGFAALPFRALSRGMPILNVFGLFGTWFVALCWAHALVNDRLRPALRWLLAAGALGWLAVQATLQYEWTSGWLPPSVALIVVTTLVRPRIGVPLLGLGVAIMAAFPKLLEGVMQSEEQQGSLGGDYGRFELWARNVELLKDQILFGTGPAGYALYYTTFIPGRAMSSHSNYIDVLAQFGVPGLICFLALLGAIGWLAWQVRPLVTDASDRANCVAILGAMPAILVGMALGDWVVPFVYNQTIAGFDHSVYTWLMFAVVCGMWTQIHFPREQYP